MDTDDRLQNEKLRDHFFEILLSENYSVPSDFVGKLGEAWQTLTNAEHSCLWLYNDYTNTWDLLTTFGRQQYPHPSMIKKDNDENKLPIVEYCSLTKQPVYIDSLNFQKTFEGQNYAVLNKREISQNGFKAFDCIPLYTHEPVPSEANESDEENLSSADSLPPLKIKGAICLHYRDPSQRIEHPNRLLLLMGRLSALTLLRSYESQQKVILVELNRIAEEYLVRVSRNPRQVRKEYLGRIVNLVKKYLEVDGVSIFYHNETHEKINCLISTGLCDSESVPINEDYLEYCTYDSTDKNWTSKCYYTGTPFIASPDDAKTHRWKYTEYDVVQKQPTGTKGAAIYPIPKPVGAEGTAVSHGILRCSGLRAIYQNLHQTFNPIGVQTIGFIAQQIGPVIETLTVRIRREQTISILKHDLYAPLNMIWDTADQLETNPKGTTQYRYSGSTQYQPKSKETIKYYDLMNLKTAAHLARSLLPQLDPDPGEIRVFDPEETYLEGDIVARLRHMLSYYAKKESDMTISYSGFKSHLGSKEDIPKLYVDRELIERTFSNLLVNAIKYGTKSTKIEVIAKQEGDEYVIEISNYGIGIPEPDSELIFQQNYRAENARSSKIGLGLGLYIGKSAMLKHRGDLTLKQNSDPTIFAMHFKKFLEKDDWWKEEANVNNE